MRFRTGKAKGNPWPAESPERGPSPESTVRLWQRRAESARSPPGSGRAAQVAVFVTDLDRTLLRPGGRATRAAKRALREVRGMGLRTVLASGRTYADLVRHARGFGEWDALVAENGAIVESPLGSTRKAIGRRVAATVRRRLAAYSDLHAEVGEVVVSVPREERRRLLRAVAGLPVDLVANVDRLMAVPSGVTKRTGVQSAMRRLGLVGAGYAAIGDAENDVELLRGARLSGAVANAERAVRSAADYRCRRPFEQGVLEFVSGPLRGWVTAHSPASERSGGRHEAAREPR
ncbi:MAG: HAD family hydrolase [Thermoplasmata archaeon]